MLMNVKLALTLVIRMLSVPTLREASIVIVRVLTLVMDSLVYVSEINMLTCYCKLLLSTVTVGMMPIIAKPKLQGNLN